MRFLAFGGFPGHAAQSKQQECLLLDQPDDTRSVSVSEK